MAKPTPEESAQFRHDTAMFTAITPEELHSLSTSGQTAFVFIGKESCSYCRRFAPKLAFVAAQNGLTIHFADSSDKKPWQNFRSQHQIPTVPALLKIASNHVSSVCNSQLSEAEIQAFLLDK